MRHKKFFSLSFILIFILSSSCQFKIYAQDQNILNSEAVIAWGTKGTTDILFRTLLKYVDGSKYNLKITPVNKTGFAGAYATNYVNNQESNGKYLLINAENPPLYEFLGYGNLDYDNFECILLIATDIVAIISPVDSEWHTFSEIVEASRAGRKITMSITNVGGLSWNAVSVLQPYTKTYFIQEWYQTDSLAVSAVFENEADFTFSKIQLAREATRNGRAKILAILSDKEFPGVKARLITEDFPEFKKCLPWGPFYGIFIKKGTDPEIISRYKQAFKEAYENEEYQKYLKSCFTIPLGLQGEEANEYINKWKSNTLSILKNSMLNMNFKFNRIGK